MTYVVEFRGNQVPIAEPDNERAYGDSSADESRPDPGPTHPFTSGWPGGAQAPARPTSAHAVCQRTGPCYGRDMSPRLEEDHPSIVIVGGFDPRVLQPHWFRAQKLLGQQEAEQAEVKAVVPQFTEWSTDALLIQVTQDRFLAQAKVESAADALRDLVLGMLQLLDQTLATALGLNRTMHFDVGGEDNWHKIGHRLAPKDLWRAHLKRQPGLKSLQIEDPTRADGLPGKVVVNVQPSLKYTHGVFFDVNNEVINVDAKPGTAFFSETIRDHWSRLLTEARSMAETVLDEAIR